MSPLFYEDSIGAKLAEKIIAVSDRVRAYNNAYIEDLGTLWAAEADARTSRADAAYDRYTSDWVPAVRPSVISGLTVNAGAQAALLMAPLDAEDIPYVWDPYPPESMPCFRTGSGAVDRPFRILVPPDRLDEVRVLLGGEPGSGVPVLPRQLPHAPQVELYRRIWGWVLAFVYFGTGLLTAPIAALLQLFSQMK